MHSTFKDFLNGKVALAVVGLALLLGCTSDPLSDNEEPKTIAGPRERVFKSDFDHVWQATQKALVKYPIKVNDMDSGTLETDYIKGDLAWVSPYQKSVPFGGRKYKINIKVLKGKVGDGAKGVQVIVAKRIEIQRDFFSPVESKPSDGLEELSLLYRIHRELEIERLLKKTAK